MFRVGLGRLSRHQTCCLIFLFPADLHCQLSTHTLSKQYMDQFPLFKSHPFIIVEAQLRTPLCWISLHLLKFGQRFVFVGWGHSRGKTLTYLVLDEAHNMVKRVSISLSIEFLPNEIYMSSMHVKMTTKELPAFVYINSNPRLQNREGWADTSIPFLSIRRHTPCLRLGTEI